MNPFDYSINQIKETANLLRQDVIKMISLAGSGHPAGSLGMADIFAVLYFKVLSHDLKDPNWEDRERVILSNGHICPILYATLARSGYFPIEDLAKLRQFGSPLQGHPAKKNLPIIEASSGSLGHGLSVACGMSLAARFNNKNYQVWCITSDGEHQEGSTWEAIMLASKYKLSNLNVIVDRNAIQLSGDVSQIMPIESLKTKYQNFGWNVIEVDGHVPEEILSALERSRQFDSGPKVVLAKTIPGKGVSFMENKWEWHGKAPNQEEAEQALRELGVDL